MAYEVDIRLSFIEPCLGNERYPDPEPNKMARNANGTVIFLQAWWRTVLSKAAQAYSKHQTCVKNVLWTPEVDGTVKLFKRYYLAHEPNGRVQRYKLHEAFDRGDMIGVRALVPDDIPLSDFRDILQLAGTYYGISPFGWKRGFGKFSVVEMRRVYGKPRKGNADVAGQPVVCIADNTAGISNSEGSNVVSTAAFGQESEVCGALPVAGEPAGGPDRDSRGPVAADTSCADDSGVSAGGVLGTAADIDPRH